MTMSGEDTDEIYRLSCLEVRGGNHVAAYGTDTAHQRGVDMPPGLLPGTTYTETAMQLEFGDLLILYADGVSRMDDETVPAIQRRVV